jgi:gamma-glutamyltranspeptidase/glutathione hydrolase
MAGRWILGGVALLLAAGAARAASRPAVEAEHGMVVSSQRLASEVGIAILKAGGNAVDAAVAVGYAEAVVNPCCGNIGGGGFMVLHLADGRDVFINFRETAPAAASANMYLDAQGNVVKGASLYGYLAAGVPGTVLGLETALAEYGSLPRAKVMAPAIRLAREGFVLTRADTDILDQQVERFRADPTVAAVFLRKDGTALQPGDRLVQRDLANTLEAIADHGPDAFYKGRIPAEIEAESKAHGGILTAADFANYKVTVGAPLGCTYRGYRFVSAPPPSSGGVTMCETLNILEGYDLKAMGFHSADAVHAMVEAMRHAYLDRNTYLGDPAFVANPIDRLLSKDYAAQIRATIPADKATASKDLTPGVAPHEKTETTHYSIVDQAGNAASVTYTVNGLFGAVVIAGHTGFFLNDEMDDFTTKPGVPNLFGLVQGTANAIAPGKRPLSSMSPTLVTKDGKVFLVLGSPGGSRIITITLETALNVIDYGMEPQEAVDAPRIHHQWLPDQVYLEPWSVSPDTARLLTGMGYKLVPQTPWGAAELIAIGPDKPLGGGPASSGNDASVGGKMRPGLRYGANDDRRPAGAAVGY